ncbi:MAG: hypothetical protein AABY22_13705 [Nanoarchaeota archaeon]
MTKNIVEIARKRRTWVSEQFGYATRNKHLSNSNKAKLMRRLWKQAKRDIK